MFSKTQTPNTSQTHFFPVGIKFKILICPKILTPKANYYLSYKTEKIIKQCDLFIYMYLSIFSIYQLSIYLSSFYQNYYIHYCIHSAISHLSSLYIFNFLLKIFFLLQLYHCFQRQVNGVDHIDVTIHLRIFFLML